jgi:catechol 2,3-dioxygenase
MLRVREIEAMLRFYSNDSGLQVNKKYHDPSDDLDVVELGFKAAQKHGESILVLKHDPNAKETRHDFAGLYHYAMLVPDRRSLASTYLAIGISGAPFEGFADHTVSESLYLHDVERNGIEIYADRPRNTWGRFIEQMKKGDSVDPREFMSLNKPLDIDSLLRELSKNERDNPSPFPNGARIGHMHLRVTNLERSVRFYHERLGLDIIGNLRGIGAAFLSAGGYHHHIGLNTWHSLEGSPHKQGEAGLEHLKIILPDRIALKSLASQFPESPQDDGRLAIMDPDGIRINVESADSTLGT